MRFILFFSFVSAVVCGPARLVCYVDQLVVMDECTHVVYSGDLRSDGLEGALREFKRNSRSKVLVRVRDGDDLKTLARSKYIQGLELSNLHKSLNRTQVSETIEDARAAMKNTKLPLLVSLPSHPELLAKYYDLRTIVKVADFMVLETHNLGQMKKTTFHQSRLSGVWDMMNTDSVVDLAIGLGVPASKIIISLPATAQKFTLSNETLSTPGSPTIDDYPEEIDQAEVCRQLKDGRWTLERDQDLSAPYAFRNNTWISFEDSSSIDVKGKYARVRGLAGMALQKAHADVVTPCGATLRFALTKVLNQQSRAPRAALLRSLEHEILAAPVQARVLDALQVSPYRITQVVDSDGVIHSIREDTRTEFSCSRQGYFVHPRSCARFYRCVKFDQLSPDYTVFEFDCPSGLAFDERYEVCVWPGSLPDAHACPGSAEIAPVPQTRFICPEVEGYYADPENCRWFFACLDHGKAPLSAYEFRCPFGLGFDESRLKCDWPWLVPSCGNIGRYEANSFGFSGAALTGAVGFQGQTADAINVAAHQSLISGASLNNLVGVQSGVLSHVDALDSNFIASQEFDARNHQNIAGEFNHALNSDLVQPDHEKHYTSGSLILDEFRYPTAKKTTAGTVPVVFTHGLQDNVLEVSKLQVNNNDNSGAYIHDPTGDYAEPYRHVGSPVNPYVHDDSPYRHYEEYQDYGLYKDSVEESKYAGNNGHYIKDNSGDYKGDLSGKYKNDDSGKYIAGIYNGLYTEQKYNGEIIQNYGSNQNNDAYLRNNNNVYTGASHALTAGAINVGLVGKTKLIDTNINAYEDFSHYGTQNFVTNPTTSGIPTTVTPITVSTAIPISTYKKIVTQPPKSYAKEIFGISNYEQAAIVSVTPKVEISDYNQAVDHLSFHPYTQGQKYEGETSGYDYSKPKISFEDGITATTPKVIVQSTPNSINYHQQVNSRPLDYDYFLPEAIEEPFKKLVAYTTGPSYVTESPRHSISSQSQSIHHVNTESQNIYYSNNQVKEHTPETQYTGSYIEPQNIKQQHTVYKNVAENFESDQKLGYAYEKPAVQFEEVREIVPEVSTAAPSLGYNNKVYHNINTYTPVSPTPKIQVYEQPSLQYVTHQKTYEQKNEGYAYDKPTVSFEETKQILPVISTPAPQNKHHKVYHKIESYTPVTSTSQPILETYEVPEIQYKPQITSQVEHNIEGNTYSESSGYHYNKPAILLQETKQDYVPNVQQYSTSHQTIHTYQPQSHISVTPAAVNIEYQPELQKQEVYLQNTAKNYKEINSGYSNEKQSISFEQYQPSITNVQHAYNKNIVHKIETPAYEQVTATPVPETIYQPQVTQISHGYTENESYDKGYQYQKPTVKFEETKYDLPTVAITAKPQSYTQQTIHRVEISTTPQPQLYQPTVTVYENPILKYTEKATPITYVKPTAPVYTQTYQPIKVQHQIQHVSYESNAQPILNQGYAYKSPEIQTNYESLNAVNSYSPAHEVSHQIIHQSYDKHQGQIIESSTPETIIRNKGYSYDTSKPTFKAPEYVPPKIVYEQSYTAPVTSHNVHHIEEHKDTQIYQVPLKQNTLQESFHISSYPGSTVTTIHESPEIQISHNREQYLPPIVSTESTATPATRDYLPPTTERNSNEYLPPKVDVTYLPPVRITPKVTTNYVPTTVSTTPKTIVEYEYQAKEYLPPHAPTYQPPSTLTPTTVYYEKEYLPPVTTARPIVVTSTQPTTTFKAPDYLPPRESNDNKVNEEIYSIKSASQSKINYNKYDEVAEGNAYSNLLGFGTVGPDAGLVLSTPSSIVSSTKSYLPPSVSTDNEDKQEVVAITQKVPQRRVKPKVAVVTKINDFNPFLVRKLGAVCSCQRPIIVLRSKKPNPNIRDDEYEDYSDEYYDLGRGDIQDLIKTPHKTRPQISKTITSTLNPIIVPDDSYYEDYEEIKREVKVLPKKLHIDTSEYQVQSTTEREVKIRPRVKSTVAPDYKSVLQSTSAPVLESSKPINRRLDASIDCQRAGLFRHPNQCNKFYACRWDTTKQRFTLHVFNCPVQLSFDPSLGACNWPSQGPSCQGDTLLTNSL